MTGADRFAIALHEAGHAVVAAALGAVPNVATVAEAGGAVAFTAPAGQARAAAALDREAAALAMMCWSAIASAGALAVHLRLSRRPRARWAAAGAAHRWASAEDAAICAAAEARLAALGIPAIDAALAAHDAARRILDRHAATVARVAAALCRHGDLGADALAALLAPAAGCTASREGLALAALDLADRFPSPPRGRPPAHPGQPCGPRTDT